MYQPIIVLVAFYECTDDDKLMMIEMMKISMDGCLRDSDKSNTNAGRDNVYMI